MFHATFTKNKKKKTLKDAPGITNVSKMVSIDKALMGQIFFFFLMHNRTFYMKTYASFIVAGEKKKNYRKILLCKTQYFYTEERKILLNDIHGIH